MPNFAPAVDALKGCFRDWRLWLIQFLGNALLFALFTAWLFIPVATAWHLILNVLLALILLAGLLVLHGGTLNYFCSREERENESLREVFRRGVWNVLAVALCAAVLYLLWLLAGQTGSYEGSLPPYLRSISPAFLRRFAGLPVFQGIISMFFFTLRWILVPGLVLPLVASGAYSGFRGLGRSGLQIWKTTVWSISYWAIVIVAVLFGVVATEKIMGWTPDFRTSTFSQETTSLLIRSLVSYFLALFAWMLACSAIGRQRQTVADTTDDPNREAVA
jgi:uncharacterized membrane protein YidH (DUF202 family)